MFLLFSLASLLQDPLSVRADSVRPRHDALAYEVHLELPDSGARIRATVATRWRLSSAEPIRIDLDTVFSVSRITVNGRTAEWRRSGFQLYVQTGAATGAEVRTEIAYEGVPADGLVIRNEGPARTFFADNWPDRARKWLASRTIPATRRPLPGPSAHRRRSPWSRPGFSRPSSRRRAIAGPGTSRSRSRRRSTPWSSARRDSPPRRSDAEDAPIAASR